MLKGTKALWKEEDLEECFELMKQAQVLHMGYPFETNDATFNELALLREKKTQQYLNFFNKTLTKSI